jgi:hypothetical protein
LLRPPIRLDCPAASTRAAISGGAPFGRGRRAGQGPGRDFLEQPTRTHAHDVLPGDLQPRHHPPQDPVVAADPGRTRAARQGQDGHAVQFRQNQQLSGIDRHAVVAYPAAGGFDSSRDDVAPVCGGAGADDQDQLRALIP